MQLRASFLSPLLSGSPKKYYCCIAGKLIYGPAVFDGNIGHFGKVIVDNVARSSGSSVTAEICKADIIGVIDGQVFLPMFFTDSRPAAENAVKDLR